MPAIFIVLIAMLATTLTLVFAVRAEPSPRTRALLVMSVGLGIIAFGVIAALVVGAATLVAMGAVGVVFIAVGTRQLRAAR